jgi:uncharacterized membrane protein
MNLDRWTDALNTTIGLIFWYSIPLTPFITIRAAWKYLKVKKLYRILVGILFALLLSFIFYNISLAIIFRGGMGPG